MRESFSVPRVFSTSMYLSMPFLSACPFVLLYLVDSFPCACQVISESIIKDITLSSQVHWLQNFKQALRDLHTCGILFLPNYTIHYSRVHLLQSALGTGKQMCIASSQVGFPGLQGPDLDLNKMSGEKGLKLPSVPFFWSDIALRVC